MEVNIPDDTRDVSDANYAKMQNENKKLTQEISNKDKALKQKSRLINKLNKKVTAANISFAEYMVDRFASQKQKSHNLQPVVNLERIHVDSSEIERATESMENMATVSNEDSDVTLADDDEALPGPSVSPDIPITIGSQKQKHKRKKKLCTLSGENEEPFEHEPLTVTKESDNQVTHEENEEPDAVFDVNDEASFETSVSQNIQPPVGCKKQGKKKGKSLVPRASKEAFGSQSSKVTKNSSRHQVVVDHNDQFPENMDVLDDRNDRNNMSFSSEENEAPLDVSALLQDAFIHDDDARDALEPPGPSASAGRQKPSGKSEGVSSRNYPIQGKCFDFDDLLGVSDEELLRDENSATNQLEQPKSCVSHGTPVRKKDKKKKFSLSKLLPKYKHKSPVKKNKKKGSKPSHAVAISEPDDMQNERVNNGTSTENEDINNNPSNDDMGNNVDKGPGEPASTEKPVLNEEVVNDNFVLETGVSPNDLFDDTREDDESEDIFKSSEVTSSQSMKARPHTLSSKKGKSLQKKKSSTASSVEIVKNPVPKTKKRPYIHKNQSKRKDIEIKNRFSRKLIEKKRIEQENKKKFENVVTFDTKTFKRADFKKIPKKTSGESVSSANHENDPLPSTSRDSGEPANRDRETTESSLDSSSD